MEPAKNSIQDVFGKIQPPAPVARIGSGGTGLSNFMSRVIEFIFIAAGIVFVFMVLISAFEWLTSGGNKEKIENARKRLIWSIIGIATLAVAFVIIRVIGQITGFDFFVGQNVTKENPEREVWTGPGCEGNQSVWASFYKDTGAISKVYSRLGNVACECGNPAPAGFVCDKENRAIPDPNK